MFGISLAKRSACSTSWKLSSSPQTRSLAAPWGVELANGDRCLAFNPLAGDQPVEGVNWQKGPLFGQPTSKDAYQLPRTYRVSLGVRF